MTAYLIKTGSQDYVAIDHSRGKTLKPVNVFEFEDGSTSASLFRVPRTVTTVRTPRNSTVYAQVVLPQFAASRAFHLTHIERLRADRHGVVELPTDEIIADASDFWLIDVQLSAQLIPLLRHIDALTEYMLEYGANPESLIRSRSENMQYRIAFAGGFVDFRYPEYGVLYEVRTERTTPPKVTADYATISRTPERGYVYPVSGIYGETWTAGGQRYLPHKYKRIANLETLRRLWSERLARKGVIDVEYGFDVLTELLSVMHGSNRMPATRDLLLMHKTGSEYEISY